VIGMGLEGLVFFKGDNKGVLEDLYRFVDSHFRGYVYNRLSTSTSTGEEELTNVIVKESRLTPYDLIVVNRGTTYEDLLRLINDPVTQRYKQYIEILNKLLEYDGENVRVKVKVGYSETIIGYEAVINNVDDVTVYAVILNLEDHSIRRVELTELELELIEDC
jgi:hypothetical protein